jgi:hypothetical protein
MCRDKGAKEPRVAKEVARTSRRTAAAQSVARPQWVKTKTIPTMGFF